MESARQVGQSMATLAVIGGIVAGFCGVLMAVIAFLEGEGIAAGVCLAAAAVAFGSVANATLRS